MKEILRNTWEKITHSSIVARVLVVMIILAVLGIAMILSGPKPPGDFDPLLRPTPIPVIEGTTTAVTPPVLSSEYKLTNGVVLAVVSVVLIILIGTSIYVLRYNKMDWTKPR